MFLPPWTWRVRERFTDDCLRSIIVQIQSCQLSGIQYPTRSGPNMSVSPRASFFRTSGKHFRRFPYYEGQKLLFLISLITAVFRVFFSQCVYLQRQKYRIKKSKGFLKGRFSTSWKLRLNEPNFSSSPFRFQHSGKRVELWRETRRTLASFEEEKSEFLYSKACLF